MSPMKHSSPVRNRFLSDQRGSIAVITAITMVPFMIAAGSAIDMGRANYTKGHMQKSVDSAALAAAATHLSVNVAGEKITGDDARIHAAKMMVDSNLIDPIASTAGDPQVTITGDMVVVDLSAEMPTSLMQLIGIDTLTLGVSAAADWSRKGHGCIVALGGNGGGIEVGGTVTLEVNDCWLHSNKVGNKSIDIYGKATIHAGGSCSVGSTSVTNNATVYRQRRTECDPIEDPKADWTPPEEPVNCAEVPGGSSKEITLYPGKYCGGLQLSGYDNVHFEPGIYYIEGGALTINSKADVTGAEVGFFLAEDVPSMTINGSSNVSLSAPTDGPMADMLVAMQPPPAGTEPSKHDLISAKINGGSELNMTGTVYVPTATLDISGNSTTLSMATQILAHSVKMTGTSHLRFQEQLDEFGNPIGPEVTRIIRLIK